MKTLVLTGSDQSMWSVLDLTLSSKRDYAASKGYDFMVLRSFSDMEAYGLKAHHIGFQRATIAMKMLNLYDNVMWIDGDSIITNFDYSITDFIQKDATFFASYDWMWNDTFSTGNFIVRKTGRTEEFFKTFIQISQHYLNHICAEQTTLNQMRIMPQYTGDFCILGRKFLNGVPSFLVDTETWKNDNNRSGIVEPWDKSFFLAHFTGTHNDERYKLMSTNKLGL